MGKNKAICNTVSAEKPGDAELSRQLGRYQKQARTWLRVGLIGIAGGVISFFAVHDAALKALFVTVLFFGGICCVLFLSSGAQKKIKSLMQEQMGMFFKAELEKAFGPDLHTPEMQIDQPLMKKLCLLEGQWEECEIENFHEGDYRGIHFSAANVRLNHVYERGNVRDGLGTWRDMVFKGLILRSRTSNTAPSPISVNMRTENNPHGVVMGNEALDQSFWDMINAFEQSVEGRILGFRWEDSIFTLALETDYGFASVASDVDLRDLDAVRGSYIASLQEMGRTLDLLLKNTALFEGQK